MKRGHVFLNIPFIEMRVSELDLKQEYLAEMVGVTRRTLIRWLDGTTVTVRQSSVEKLAKTLDCKFEDIVVAREGADANHRWVESSELSRIINDQTLFEALSHQYRTDIYSILATALGKAALPEPQFGRLLSRASTAKWVRYDFAEALDFADRAVAIAKKWQDWKLLASAQAQRARIYATAGKFEQADGAFAEVLRLKRYLDEFEDVEATVLSFRYNASGDYQRSLIYGLREEELARGTNRHGFACTSLASTYTNLDRHTEALTYLDKALEAADRLKSDVMKIIALMNKSLVLFDLAEREESLATFSRAESLSAEKRPLSFFAVGAIICASHGNTPKAHALLEEAYERYSGNRLTTIYLDRRKAEVLWYSGDVKAALKILKQVERDYDDCGAVGKRDCVRRQLSDWNSSFVVH